jgi:hypothetical protein
MDECLQRKSTQEINLWNVSDTFWTRMLEYGAAGGASSDPWNASGTDNNYFEYEPTSLISREDAQYFPNFPSGSSDIPVVQPCNTVSNVAYIWTMLTICQHETKHEWAIAPESVTALVQTFNVLTIGSAFRHASNTRLGGLVDNNPIKNVALIMHQSALQGLPYHPILYDLGETPATLSGHEQAIELSKIIVSEPVVNWDTKIRRLNPPRCVCHMPFFGQGVHDVFFALTRLFVDVLKLRSITRSCSSHDL